MRGRTLDACKAVAGKCGGPVPKAEDEDPPPDLGHPKVCGIQESNHDAVPERRAWCAQPCHDVSQIGGIRRRCQARHILEYEDLRFDLTHDLVEMSQQVSFVGLTASMTGLRPRLAGRTTREESDARPKLGVVKSLDVRGVHN